MKALKDLNKKGQVGNLYTYILIIGMVGILLGVVLTVLANLGAATGVSGAAETAINDTIDALGSIATDWLSIIIVVAVAAIILYLVMRFGGSKR